MTIILSLRNKFVKSFFLLLVLFFFQSTVFAQQQRFTLEECIQLAIDRNIVIKQSELDQKNAIIEKSNAFGNFLPRIDANSSHSWNTGLNQDITTGLLKNRTTQFTSFGVSVSGDIYKGAQNLNRIRQANLKVLAQRYQLENITDDVMLNVVNAYLQVMFNRELLEVQKKQIDLTEKELERTEKLTKEGALAKSNVYEIEANLASQKQELIKIDNDYRLAQINLAQLLLITDYENFNIADEEFDEPSSLVLDENPKTIFEKALSFRRDIKLAATNIEIAEKGVKIAKGAFMPTLRGFYNYNNRISYSDQVVEALPFIEQLKLNGGHSFGFQLSIPIFNRNFTKNDVKRKQVDLLRAQNQLEQDKLKLETSVNKAYYDTRGASKFYEAARKTLISRTVVYENAQVQFKAGAMNSFDFVQAKQSYESAVSDVVRAKYDYIFKLKVLEYYFGIPIASEKIVRE